MSDIKARLTHLGAALMADMEKDTVDFAFDRTRQRADMSKVEWQTTHNRKSNRQVGQEAAEAMACGGGKDQMEDAMQ